MFHKLAIGALACDRGNNLLKVAGVKLKTDVIRHLREAEEDFFAALAHAAMSLHDKGKELDVDLSRVVFVLGDLDLLPLFSSISCGLGRLLHVGFGRRSSKGHFDEKVAVDSLELEVWTGILLDLLSDLRW